MMTRTITAAATTTTTTINTKSNNNSEDGNDEDDEDDDHYLTFLRIESKCKVNAFASCHVAHLVITGNES